MAGIGMNKGRGVSSAKKGIGVPNKPAGIKPFGAGPVLRGPKPSATPNTPAGAKKFVATGPGRGGQMKRASKK